MSASSHPDVATALALADGLDGALSAGLARLVPQQRAALTSFANAFAGSPLGGAANQAVSALAGGDPSAHHLVVLAAARAGLFGAVADALLAERGITLAPVEVEAAPSPTAEQKPRLDGLRPWLVEVALAGFSQLDAATLAPILPTVSAIQQTPGLERLAGVVTGFMNELLDHAPTSALPEVPARRWADLWTRCLLATVALPERVSSNAVSGRLAVLGADVRQHEQLVSCVVHGVFDSGDGVRRFVRTTLSSWKVDAIAGADVWNLLRPKAPVLVAALGSPAILGVSGTLSATGELTIAEVTDSQPFDPFALDLGGVLYAPPAPRDRHPIQIAVPARDVDVPLDLSRSGPLLDLRADVSDAASVLGLLRWDDGWRLQPMLIRTKKGKIVGPAATLAAAEKVKADARAVLAERSSKLLRPKA
jgi:hypothetical protein